MSAIVGANGNGHLLEPNGSLMDPKIVNGNKNISDSKIDVEDEELPHITSNIIPLSNVLKFYCQEAYKLLNTQIENLSITRGKENDIIRKKKFLNLLVSTRQDFIKIYTLVKWASRSKEISKLIDILSWLRTQEFYFEQLSIGLNGLNGFSGAKLPNSDLITSMEVLVKGRPQLPTHNYFKTPKLSTNKVLKVIEEMNLILTTRMALSDEIPIEFLKNHKVKDGAIIFTLDRKYEATITIGDDLIVELDADYSKSPYFLIDFKFLFGIEPVENILKTDLVTTLPIEFWKKLELQANSVLMNSNLSGLYDLLNNFTKRFKFNLIHQQQLKESKVLNWSHIKYKNQGYDKILISYWNNPNNSIEVLVNKLFDIEFKWFKNSKEMDKDHCKDITINNDEFNIEYLMNSILNKHCEILMLNIAHSNSKIFKLINPYQILIKLTNKKSSILSIDSLTGRFYFLEPTFVENKILKQINNAAIGSNNSTNSITEAALVDLIHKKLIELKLEAISMEIRNKLVTMEWITNHIINLKDQELIKLKYQDQKISSLKIQFFRCKNWPSSWFLINLIDEEEFSVNWFASRIKSIRGEWILEWISNLQFTQQELNFEFFNSLASVCTDRIIDNMILQELNAKNIEYFEIPRSHNILKRFDIEQVSNSKNERNKSYELVLLIYNDGHYLPIRSSSNSFVLMIELINEGDDKLIKIKLKSKLKLKFNEFAKLDIKNLKLIDKEGDEGIKFLEVKEEMKLTNSKLDLNLSLMNDIFDSLTRFKYLIGILNELVKKDVRILEFNKVIKIYVNDVFKELYITLPERSKNDIIEFSPTNESTIKYVFKTPETESRDLKLITTFINRTLSYKKPMSLMNIINYLNQITPIFQAITNLRQFFSQKNKQRLNNGLNKLSFDVKFTNLNNVQLLFSINYINPPNSKRIQRDKITLSIRFKINKFKKGNNPLDLNISLLDNVHIKNLKYKKLFELLFKTLSGNDNVTNLNYDFIIDLSVVNEFLIGIGNSFITYIENDVYLM